MRVVSELLEEVSRPEPVDPNREYVFLGTRWYAGGLFVKEKKSGTHVQASKVYRVEPGDFVYNRLFAWKGSFALAEEAHAGCYVSNEFPCFAVRRNLVEPKYLLWYFSRPDTWTEALGLSSGGTPTSRNRLKEGRFLELQVPVPPLAHQRALVAAFDDLKTLRDRVAAMSQKVDALLPSALNDILQPQTLE